jgi:hypothetical protein
MSVVIDSFRQRSMAIVGSGSRVIDHAWSLARTL